MDSGLKKIVDELANAANGPRRQELSRLLGEYCARHEGTDYTEVIRMCVGHIDFAEHDKAYNQTMKGLGLKRPTNHHQKKKNSIFIGTATDKQDNEVRK